MDPCEHQFLDEYFPLSKTTHLRNSITCFMKNRRTILIRGLEQIHGAFMIMPASWIGKMARHLHLLQQDFICDEGVLRLCNWWHIHEHRLDEAEDIIENVALNYHQWATKRGNPAKTIDKYDVNTLDLIVAKMDALTKIFEYVNVNVVNVTNASVRYVVLRDKRQIVGAISVQVAQVEQVDAIN